LARSRPVSPDRLLDGLRIKLRGKTGGGKEIFRCLLVIGFLSLTTVAFGFIPVIERLDEGVEPNMLRSGGTYHFYYYDEPTYYFIFGNDTYVAVNFDPTDNFGDTTADAYVITYVDSSWYCDYGETYDVALYICNDVEGLPDLSNPRYESGPFEPDYYPNWTEYEISPPVHFNGGAVCWVVFLVPYPDGHPISDGDGNSGHSWVSDDGETWELETGVGGVDWYFGVYAEPGTVSDYEPPYITDTYPVNDDWPCGVPPTEDTAGCHWQDGDPESNVGVDVNASTFDVRDHDGYYVTGDLNIDDGDIFDVVVLFDVDGVWEEDENYAVETVCYDLAGNSTSEFWIFSTGYTIIEEKSFGSIKAGFAE
jgi:hypothetical protein